MNENNLIPNTERTPSELREITQKGGKKSGAARRKKRDMRKCMELLLSLPASSEADYQLLADMGITFGDLSEDEINNLLVVNAALLREAKAGDVAAVKELRSIIRDDDMQKHKIKIERERLRLERERFEFEKAQASADEDDEGAVIVDDL